MTLHNYTLSENSNKLSAFTLMEVLIVIGIVIILTAITLPSFSEFSKKREFENEVDSFVDNVRALQNKSLSGAVQEGEPVRWLFVPNCGTNRYSFGYWDNTIGDYVSLQSYQLADGLTFGAVAAECHNFSFDRITGQIRWFAPGTGTIVIYNNREGYSKTMRATGAGQIIVE